LQDEIKFVAEGDGWLVERAAQAVLSPQSADLPSGLFSVRRLTAMGETKMTYSFLAVRDHSFFKIRFTAHEGVITNWGDEFSDVVDVFYPAIYRTQPAPQPEFKVNILANVFEAAGNQGCALGPWLLYPR
jgi:hypothetical protein